MILKYELLLIIVMQVFSIVMGRIVLKKDKIIWNFHWVLAMASNVFHLYMLMGLLNADLDSDDKELFIKLIMGFLLTIISEICFLFTQMKMWNSKMFPVAFIVIQVYLIRNAILFENKYFTIIVFEVNCFAFVVDSINRMKKLWNENR